MFSRDQKNFGTMNIRAPTQESDNADKDWFYQIMKTAYDSIPSNDIKMVIGDLNAKLG